MTRDPDLEIGEEVVVCLPGSPYDGLSGTVVATSSWQAPDAVRVETVEGTLPFGRGALRRLWPEPAR